MVAYTYYNTAIFNTSLQPIHNDMDSMHVAVQTVCGVTLYPPQTKDVFLEDQATK